jgi:hypothetical protein
MRSNPPLANSAKAPPCPSLPASAGLVLRSHRKGSNVVRSVPFCVNRWDRPPDDSDAADNVAERCQAVASLGGEHPTPFAQSAKALPPRSLLSDRRPDAAEPRPPKTATERCRAVASLGGEHPTPSRKARKLILLGAYSANGGPIPRSPCDDSSRVKSVPFCVDRWDRPLRIF